MADRTVGGLPRAAGLYDDSLLVMEQQGKAQSLTGEQLKRYARAGVSEYVEDAKNAAQKAQEAVKDAASSAQTAQEAKDAAQNARQDAQAAQEGAEKARRAIEDLEVSAATLPTGTPASVEKTVKEDHVLLRLGLPAGERGPQGLPGSNIRKIERTAGTGAAGTVDTYTVTLTDGGTTQFQVRNGADGKGAGDMLHSVYDPEGRAQDIFAYADGLLPAVRAVTLAADGWTGTAAPYSQTVSVPGVVPDEAEQIICPAPASASCAVWNASGIQCTAQGSGTLTFTAQEKPGADIPVNVAVQAARKGGTP